MPSSINGIGTRYFLKRNRQVEEAQCPHCNNRVKLESYETWYCVCVLFIPVLPIGKRQILNQCPLCTRHQVITFAEWEKIRAEAISETSEEFADAKDNPEAAIKMHGTLLAFQKATEAERLAEIMLNRFGDVAQVQFYLGACFERLGKAERGNACFLRAYELAPEDLNMRRAAALVLMEQKKLDDAKPLLEAFGPETDQFQPPLFFVLGKAYQADGRHSEAVDTFKMLLRKQPGLAAEKEFAKALRASEKALGVEKPTLPPDPWYRKSGIVWSLIAATVLGGVGGWNYYTSQHRTLSVVNGLSHPIAVRIDGNISVEVPGNGRKEITVPEGSHEAEVLEPAGRFEKSQFELRTGWWERFFRSPVFIADPSQTAVVNWEQTVYSDIRGLGAADNKFELRIGHPFTSFPHADYHFESFPQQLKAKQGSRVTKSRVDIVHEPPTSVLNLAFGTGQEIGQLDQFVENHLISNPEDGALLNAYIGIGVMQGQVGRRQEFLERRLSELPIRITWHRRYQDTFSLMTDAANGKAKHAELVVRYDNLLKQNPKEAALLYLRGRLEPHARQCLPLLDQALEIDPKQSFATGAKAYAFLALGRNEQALAWYRKAVALAPDDADFVQAMTDSQFANQDFVELERSLREQIEKTPERQDANLELFKVLILTKRAEQAEQQYQALSGRLRLKLQGMPQIAALTVRHLELPYLYAREDFQNLGLRAQQAGAENQDFAFAAALEQGKLMDVPQSTMPMLIPYWHLCRSLVARQSGDAVQAAASKDAALKILNTKAEEGGVAAELLTQGPNARFEDVEDLLLQPQLKTVLLVALAEESPHIKTQCLDLAEKLNYSLKFPYYLVQRNIARLRQP